MSLRNTKNHGLVVLRDDDLEVLGTTSVVSLDRLPCSLEGVDLLAGPNRA